jgi:hypothetical protein
MKLIRLLHEMLREIFEESAYDRFCTKEGVSSGRASYASFLRDLQRVGSNVRCC